jgi:2-hydroxychromene-2-carboxylate isomerase
MAPVIDYWFATISPWTWLGHERLVALARAHGAAVRVRPVDFGRIFAASGGLPLGQRAPQRQAYRLVELQRWSAWLGVPLNLHPKHFPVPGDAAARLILAVAAHDGEDAALGFTGRVLRAVWVEERDISNTDHLALLLAEAGLHARRLADAGAPGIQARYDELTQQAIAANVFGAPSYVVDGEIFWGQDRLDFLERRLAGG